MSDLSGSGLGGGSRNFDYRGIPPSPSPYRTMNGMSHLAYISQLFNCVKIWIFTQWFYILTAYNLVIMFPSLYLVHLVYLFTVDCPCLLHPLMHIVHAMPDIFYLFVMCFVLQNILVCSIFLSVLCPELYDLWKGLSIQACLWLGGGQWYYNLWHDEV